MLLTPSKLTTTNKATWSQEDGTPQKAVACSSTDSEGQSQLEAPQMNLPSKDRKLLRKEGIFTVEAALAISDAMWRAEGLSLSAVSTINVLRTKRTAGEGKALPSGLPTFDSSAPLLRPYHFLRRFGNALQANGVPKER